MKGLIFKEMIIELATVDFKDEFVTKDFLIKIIAEFSDYTFEEIKKALSNDCLLFYHNTIAFDKGKELKRTTILAANYNLIKKKLKFLKQEDLGDVAKIFKEYFEEKEFYGETQFF